jgi:SAM-dependent methyltransferase
LAIFDNTKFYEHSVIKYGVSPKGVHWISKETQEKRFEILLKFIKDDLYSSSLIDAGCGFGDLIKYFSSKNLYPKSYIGIDKEDFFIQIASSIYPNTKFLQLDILKDKLPQTDYYICSGAMNILEENEMQLFIKKCINSSKKGFIFNFLKKNTFNSVKKEDIISFCQKLNVAMKIEDNYLENDITIFLQKT